MILSIKSLNSHNNLQDFSHISGDFSPMSLEDSDSPLKRNPLASQADEDDGFIDAIDDEVADVS